MAVTRRLASILAMTESMLQQEASEQLQKLNKNLSGCGAVGSARSLGAGHRPQGFPKSKTLKSLVNIDFFGTILFRKILYKSGLTTCLTTYKKLNISSYRGVA